MLGKRTLSAVTIFLLLFAAAIAPAATITSNAGGGGNWGTGATWAGGVAPADNDAVVIAAGDTVIMDQNLSAYVTGIAGITITSHATVPGMLQFKNDASGTYYLRMKAGTNIVGTNLAAKGRLLMAGGDWTTPTDLDFARKHIIEFLGAAAGYLDLTYLDLKAQSAQPTNLSVTTYGTAYPVVSVTPATDIIDLGTPPPAAGTAVIVRSTGTLPGGLSNTDLYYVRAISGNTCKFATQNSDASIVDITSTGSGTITVYTGYAAGSATVNVIENVTADTPWVAAATAWNNGASHNAAVLVDSGPPETYDQQRLSIATINAGTMVLSDAVDSVQWPGAKVFLSSRNVRIISNTTGAGTPIISAGTGAIIQAEVRMLAGTGTTFYGYGINAGTSHTVSGTVSGCSVGINAGTSHTVSGTVSGCSTGINAGTSHTVSGTVSGCSTGINGGSSHTVSGTVSGCSTGINGGSSHTVSGTVSGCSTGINVGTSHTVSGTVSGCSTGINVGTSHTVSGTVSGCSTGINGGTSHTVSGTVSGCSTGIYGGSTTLRSCTLRGNAYDLRAVSSLEGQGATLASSVQNYQYLQAVNDDWRTNVIYDIGGATGQIKAWTNGGTVVTEAAPESPPVALDYAYKHTGEVATRQTWVDVPMWGKKDTALTINIYEKSNAAPSTFTIGPTFEIINPGLLWGDAGAILDSATAQADGGDDTAWHTLTLSYTPTTDRPLILRARMADASKYFHWMFSIAGESGGNRSQIGGKGEVFELR